MIMMGGSLPPPVNLDVRSDFNSLSSPHVTFFHRWGMTRLTITNPLDCALTLLLLLLLLQTNLMASPDPGLYVYSDVARSSEQAAAIASCLSDSYLFTGRLAYIRTINDKAVPVVAQDAMLAGSGIQWITWSLSSSHSLQLSMLRGHVAS